MSKRGNLAAAKKNAMTSSMYGTMADLLNGAAKDDPAHLVLWHGAGEFSTRVMTSKTSGRTCQDQVKAPKVVWRWLWLISTNRWLSRSKARLLEAGPP